METKYEYTERDLRNALWNAYRQGRTADMKGLAEALEVVLKSKKS